MKREEADDLPAEVDFSAAARGRSADRFPPRGRDERLAGAWPAMVEELSAHTLRQVRELEATLFTFFVLAEREPVQKAARHAAAVLDCAGTLRADGTPDDRGDCGIGDADLRARLRAVAEQRGWVRQPRPPFARNREAAQPVLLRLERIYDEVHALRRQIEAMMEERLVGAGMTPAEIERRTEETARLWTAA